MNNMTKFFNFYESSSVEILQKIRDGEKEMRELQELINKLEQEINQLRYGRGYTKWECLFIVKYSIYLQS